MDSADGEGVGVGADALEPGPPAPAVATPVLPSVASTTTITPALPHVDGNPSDSPRDRPRPSTPTEAPTRATSVIQNQGAVDIEAPDRPDCRSSPHGADPLTASGDLLANARESGWMRSKGTLGYFREVCKTRELSNLVLHWYQLEEALGFPEKVNTLYPSWKNVS